MPKPKKDESEKEFVDRCIPILIDEGKKPDQASAVCHNMYKNKDKKSSKDDESSKDSGSSKDKEYGKIHNFSKIKQVEVSSNGDYEFLLETTVPDRVGDPEGGVAGEILSKNVLDKHASFINNPSKMGGSDFGSYRTIGLFHDRVKHREMMDDIEEAGFIRQNAEVVPLDDYGYKGYHGLKVSVGVNDMYEPAVYKDYTPEKIRYKIENGVLGLSVEYNNKPEQESIIGLNGENYRYIHDSDQFYGASFARADLIGNPTAIRLKEIEGALKSLKGGNMPEENKELETLSAKLKEVEDKISKVEEVQAKDEDKSSSEDEDKESLEDEKKEVEEKIKELKLKQDDFASKVKEDVENSLKLALSNVKVKQPIVEGDDDDDKSDAKIKEMSQIISSKDSIDWSRYSELAASKIKEQESFINKTLRKEGFDLEDTSLKVKCTGRSMKVVPTAKTKELLVKTKDDIDANDMSNSTYYQTNAFFADQYVPGITETFLKEDNLLTAMIKEEHIAKNDKYQWKIWTEFETVTGSNTLAVDPNNTSVATQQRDFIKLETPIREYRDAVEVTDFTQYHSAVEGVGKLMGVEMQRAAEAVTNSMNADLFKAKSDDTSGWNGLLGLEAVADSSTYSDMYGRTRSATNRLLNSTLTNTYDSTSEAVSVALVREGYEKVLGQGSSLADIAVVISPTQVRKLFDSEDAAIRYNILTMAANPHFGFKRDVMPHIDGIPMIRDYRCTDSSGSADRFFIVDLGSNGFVLVVSKPLMARGLAKVGTSEKAYVSFWGASVYKRPRNIFCHTNLTT